MKAKVDFKIYDVTDWEAIIAVYILPNTSRSKGKQTIKCSQLKGYTIRNIFLQKSR